MSGFLPVCREDMDAEGITQLDFVYVTGDAYVDHHRLATQSSAGCYRRMGTAWAFLHSRTGKIRIVLRYWACRGWDFWLRLEIWILW